MLGWSVSEAWCIDSGAFSAQANNKKPLMERFRRRKINNYLEELKHLVLTALNREVGEVTLKFLTSVSQILHEQAESRR